MELSNIRGITFAPFANKGVLGKRDAFKSLEAMKERTNANFVMLVPCGLMETPQSEIIRYDTDATMSDKELIAIIQHAKKLGLNVGIRPTINCKNGIYRAYVSFFDTEVPNEPCWRNWFKSYTDFQLHYAQIAKNENVDMFVCGSELVMSEAREDDWKCLIKQLRIAYDGILTYNTEMYLEDHISWWSELDAICSSGYYPIDAWEKELDRIEPIVKKYNLPFFIAQAGCMSSSGASAQPRNWRIRSSTNVKEQERWYESMLFSTNRRPWVKGQVLWCWSATPYALRKAAVDWGYDIMGKPAERVVYRYFSNQQTKIRP